MSGVKNVKFNPLDVASHHGDTWMVVVTKAEMLWLLIALQKRMEVLKAKRRRGPINENELHELTNVHRKLSELRNSMPFAERQRD